MLSVVQTRTTYIHLVVTRFGIVSALFFFRHSRTHLSTLKVREEKEERREEESSVEERREKKRKREGKRREEIKREEEGEKKE